MVAMVDTVDISMENEHQRICLKMVSVKGKLRLMPDMVLGLAMVLDLMDMDMGMVLGMVMDMDMVMDTAMAMDWEAMAMDTLMATVMAMVAMVDTVDISMENEHQRICLKMVSVKGKLRLMP